MPEASAPGKLLLSGEYAVLHGAPAVVVAVETRARARVEPAAASQLVVGDRTWAFHCAADTGLSWQGAAPGTRGALLSALVAELHAGRHRWQPRHVRIELDSSELQLRDAAGAVVKAGLGSSAAVLVALAAALLPAWEVRIGAAEFVELVLSAHRHFQGGRGSGVDVLSAIHGGLLRVAPTQDPPACRTLRWPEGLVVLPVWSGKPASTPQRIAAYSAFRASDPAAGKLIVLLEQAAREAADAWERGAPADILSAMAGYADALAAVDQAGDIGVRTPEHRELAALAARCGAVYKISGAGGGDFGLALTDDADRALRLKQVFTEAGYQLPPMALPAAGLRRRD